MDILVKIKKGPRGRRWQWHAFDGAYHFASSAQSFMSQDEARADASWRLMCAGITCVSHEVLH